MAIKVSRLPVDGFEILKEGTTSVSGQKDKMTDDRVDQFLKFVIRMRSKRDYSLHEIGNMDETPGWLEMPGKSTLEPAGSQQVHCSGFLNTP